VLYGGAIHFAKEAMQFQGQTIYGLMAEFRNGNKSILRTDCPLTKTTQEHGIMQVPSSTFNQYQIGDVILVYPIHSCLVVQAMGEYLNIHNGKQISTMVQQCVNRK